MERMLPHIEHLSAQLALLRIVGHGENEGHKLIPEEKFESLQQQWCDRVVTASTDLSDERDLGKLLLRFAEIRGDDGFAHVRGRLDDNGLFAQFLESLASESHRFAMGDVAVRTQLEFPWDYLCSRFGEEYMIERITDLLERTSMRLLDHVPTGVAVPR